jgi:hypothetical protein
MVPHRLCQRDRRRIDQLGGRHGAIGGKRFRAP